jgi:hypothetical protein
LIFFVYHDPRGSEENQFIPPGAGVNKLIFKRFKANVVYPGIYSLPTFLALVGLSRSIPRDIPVSTRIFHPAAS